MRISFFVVFPAANNSLGRQMAMPPRMDGIGTELATRRQKMRWHFIRANDTGGLIFAGSSVGYREAMNKLPCRSFSVKFSFVLQLQ
jgi:hypothetical protein